MALIKKRNSRWYLVDGEIRKSLKTSKKTLAEARLRQYIHGKFGLTTLTWQQWYDEWIKADKAPFVRPGGIADYEQHCKAYISAEFAKRPMAITKVGVLKKFRQKLTNRELSMGTCENIINSTMRAMWRDAMIEGHFEANPFALLQWARQPRKRPDPYTAQEREQILKWWEENDFFFYPYVYFQFHTGCRPSETAALEQEHVNETDRLITINGSLVMGEEGATRQRGQIGSFRLARTLLISSASCRRIRLVSNICSSASAATR